MNAITIAHLSDITPTKTAKYPHYCGKRACLWKSSWAGAWRP